MASLFRSTKQTDDVWMQCFTRGFIALNEYLGGGQQIKSKIAALLLTKIH